MAIPKIIALYLPQYHRIPENDKFWGEGFTDWVTVRNAKPLFDGHNQPRVPLNNNYYDLSQKENVAWQAQLAKEYGIYGFGVYHYWFNNEQNLLTKPAEIIRDNDDIDLNYCFIWDNNNWKRSWSNVEGNDWAPTADNDNQQGPEILVKHILGQQADWEKHFNYLLTHFQNKKYIKLDNKPIFSIISYRKELIPMCDYWEKLAKQAGFDGIQFIFQSSSANNKHPYLHYNYEPHTAGWMNMSLFEIIINKIKTIIYAQNKTSVFNFGTVWRKLLKQAKKSEDKTLLFGAFIGYDDSPRRGSLHSKVVIGNTPTKFGKYFSELMQISKEKEKEFVFLSAWNEWGEGMFLEPDTTFGYSYLEEIKHCIENLK